MAIHICTYTVTVTICVHIHIHLQWKVDADYTRSRTDTHTQCEATGVKSSVCLEGLYSLRPLLSHFSTSSSLSSFTSSQPLVFWHPLSPLPATWSLALFSTCLKCLFSFLPPLPTVLSHLFILYPVTHRHTNARMQIWRNVRNAPNSCSIMLFFYIWLQLQNLSSVSVFPCRAQGWMERQIGWMER